MADVEKGVSKAASDIGDETSSISIQIGQDHLADVVPPHESYEGYHRFDPTATWTAEEERAVVFKTDILLLSWICFMFFGLQLDRGNLSNALTDDFLADLNMTSDDYNDGSSIQLVCFLTAEFPVQMVIKRLGFRRVLPVMVMLWSIVSFAQAWMTGRASFFVTRALIGALEGGFIPGTILFATYFYKSKELAIRLSLFWATLNVARIVSSLLAAGILEMRGTGGKPGWFWLFLIDGLLTFVIGAISFLYLPSSPTNTTSVLVRKPWYTPRQETIMINRLLRDDPSKGLTHIHEAATFRDVLNTWSDSSMWGLYFIGLIAYIPQSPVSSYLSLTLKRLGFDTFQANMLSIPYAALQIICMLLLSKSSDYFGERTWHCFFGEFWSLPLLAALLSLPNGGDDWGRFTISTMIAGYPYFHPIVSAWISENTFDVKKRAITAATYNVIVQIGSVISSQIYRTDDEPYYHRGNKVLISICCLSLAVFVLQRQYLRYLNRQKERKWNAMSHEEQLEYQADREAREKEGNKRLDFRFKY
ncbi:hypothetical protein ASPZODRAFT_132743 [Penicilliopsis zonata CBS 506.65]|uniref:Major facilitator superfamily (MFS) profile domain-containing protein n=1 Tax=Penicilliopsis zonata CBS 506.65 TaxID=1073090 RepID=A0A1L9SHG4_9EURO|nr:hypothetical protein ASPZODRAFT_132743 [Penicilliopsis zonata CBS 506.65]OJJ46645.1 hypothetical protein ASPZODRAFT_132743 [Penicilliopsis zonata CBS 506.65]